jgi:hypothetical protein
MARGVLEKCVLSLLVVVVVSDPCSASAFSFIGPFFQPKLFVNVTPDNVLSKSMHPLAESAVVRVQYLSGF